MPDPTCEDTTCDVVPPAITLGPCTLYHGRAQDVLPTLPDHSVHLLLVDPPYFRVKMTYDGESLAWDRQWSSREGYLAWLRGLAKEWQRVLVPNGSLYCFASPQMAAWVEVTLSETFNVLNHLVWCKHDGSGAGTGRHSKVCKEDLMSFFPQTERILFAEQYGSDYSYDTALVTENASYWSACERLKMTLFGAVIRDAMTGTSTTAKEVTEAIGAYGKVNHGGAVSNWLQGYNIPSKEQYAAMRSFFNSRHGSSDYLRREYEDLRRPFTLNAQMPYTDVWSFATVAVTPGKHPCQKPLPLLRHIITTSSRPGDVVLDCFAGSCSTLEAAKQVGRLAIGIESDHRWIRHGRSVLSQENLFTD